MDKLTEILGLSVHDMGNDMKKTIDQHRAEFEEWYSQYWDDFYRLPSGDYMNDSQYFAWEAWKAARGIKE